jgi:hypothetical protein
VRDKLLLCLLLCGKISKLARVVRSNGIWGQVRARKEMENTKRFQQLLKHAVLLSLYWELFSFPLSPESCQAA